MRAHDVAQAGGCGLMARSPLSWVARAAIRFYQRYISPMLPNACIYVPSCSQYTLEAIEKYGVVQGCWLGARRIVRCNPLHGGGYDPVP